jgi:molybdopterin converting factor small subunit
MKVRVRLFAQYREWAGQEEFDMELPPGASAQDLISRVRSVPLLQQVPVLPAIAINQVYAPLSTRLQDGDEIALIPPVAGG